MEINQVLSFVASKGAMFWVATFSVALGLTLIIGAAYAQTRRLKSPAKAPGRVSSGRPAAGAGTAPARPDTPAVAPDCSEPVPPPAPAGLDPVTSREVRQLLARVRQAVETLESLQIPPAEPVFEADDSLLKVAGGDVEYIYRAGKG